MDKSERTDIVQERPFCKAMIQRHNTLTRLGSVNMAYGIA